jgi:hypothetical protein
MARGPSGLSEALAHVGVLLADRGGEIGLVLHHRGSQRVVGGREDPHRQESGVLGVPDRDRRDGDAAGHLDDREQRVEAFEALERYRHADDRERGE